MRTIHKYPLKLARVQRVVVPSGPSGLGIHAARFLSAQVQVGQLVLWALVDTEAAGMEFEVCVLGTGHDAGALAQFLDRGDAQHVGTAQHGGEFVWHVFVAWPPTPVPT